jgi:hypothetical protein
MAKGRAAIEVMWKNMAEQVGEPKLTTLDVKPLGPSAAREIGTFSLKTKDAKFKLVQGEGPAVRSIVREILLFSCMALFITGIVVALASLLI